MKKESDSLERKNRELEGGINIDEEELEALRLELEKEKRKSVGVEEYARRKYQEYERNLMEEQKRNGAIVETNQELLRKDQENERKLYEISRQIEAEKVKRREVAEIASRKARELEGLNNQLMKQLNEGEYKLKERNNDINRLKVEQDRADTVIKTLSRKSDINKKEIEQYLRELEGERRQTSSNQEGVGRKIKSMED